MMCSEYVLYTKLKKVDESLGFTIRGPKVELDEFSYHVRIYGQAPIIVAEKADKLRYDFAQFSLLPPPPRFSTFNARLSDWDDRSDREIPIFEKKTWGKPFSATRCLVPMTGFLEPIYMGEHAGKVMRFESRDDDVLFAPGFYQESKHPKEPGEIYLGFCLIIHTPLEFVLKVGHHRTPMLLKPADARKYLTSTMTVGERYEFLLDNRYAPKLKAETERQMAKGWEKRIRENEEAHDEEMRFVKRFTAR